MGEAYPEIREKGDFVSQVVKSEEERFLETVDRGLELLNQEIAKLGKKEEAFRKGGFQSLRYLRVSGRSHRGYN